MSSRTTKWALLLERLALRETLDVLKGYSFPPAARQTLCQQYALSEEELTTVLRLHKSLYGRAAPKPLGPGARHGLDLLLDLPKLRAEVDQRPLASLLAAPTLHALRLRFKLKRIELVRVLEAHAELLARP